MKRSNGIWKSEGYARAEEAMEMRSSAKVNQKWNDLIRQEYFKSAKKGEVKKRKEKSGSSWSVKDDRESDAFAGRV